MNNAAPYQVPPEPGRWRALTLAAVVHLALFAFLWFGVRWQSKTPVAIEAEVWSPQTREAAPLPQPQPEPEPQPKPEPTPQPVVKSVPKPVVEPPVAKQPDIALEQEKKRKAQLQKEQEEEARREKIKEEKQKREEEEKEKQRLAKLQADEKLKQEKLKEEKQRLEKEKADALAKKKADDLKKQAAEKKRKQDQLDQAALDKARADDLKRMMAQAGSGGSGDAPKSQGSRGSAAYAGRVGAKIKSNTVFNVPDNLAGNPPVEYAVELLPDGSIRGIHKTKSSGVPGFDEAVLKAIEKSQPYPPDKDGRVPSGFNVIHKPKDQ